MKKLYVFAGKGGAHVATIIGQDKTEIEKVFNQEYSLKFFSTYKARRSNLSNHANLYAACKI